MLPLLLPLFAGCCAAAGTGPPLLPRVPPTSFSCADHPAGYYADMEAGCQAYHMCDTTGRQYSYLCPNHTAFHQRLMVCDHWHRVDCGASDSHFSVNTRMAGGGVKLPQAERYIKMMRRRNEEKKNRASKTSKSDKHVKKKLSTKKLPPRKSNTLLALNRKVVNKKLRPSSMTVSQKDRITTKSKVPDQNKSAELLDEKVPLKVDVIPKEKNEMVIEDVSGNINPRDEEESTPNSRNEKNSPGQFQMFPGMVARGSRFRGGFGFTMVSHQPNTQPVASVPRFEHIPLFIELSRQLTVPRRGIILENQEEINVVESKPRKSVDSRKFKQRIHDFGSSEEETNGLKGEAINPPKARPLKPIVIPANSSVFDRSTPRPIRTRGRKQETITHLEERITSFEPTRLLNTNRRNSSTFDHFLAFNRAYFIPERIKAKKLGKRLLQLSNRAQNGVSVRRGIQLILKELSVLDSEIELYSS